MTIREQVIDILKEVKPESYAESDEIEDCSELDSLELFSLITRISDVFEIEIEFEDLDMETFKSVSKIVELIERYSK